MRFLGLWIAILLAMSLPSFGIALLSIALVGGWYVWPALKGYLWTDKLPPPERDTQI